MKETLYESIKNINDINTLLSLKNDFNEMLEKAFCFFLFSTAVFS
jgi:hypothetical protein